METSTPVLPHTSYLYSPYNETTKQEGCMNVNESAHIALNQIIILSMIVSHF